MSKEAKIRGIQPEWDIECRNLKRSRSYEANSRRLSNKRKQGGRGRIIRGEEALWFDYGYKDGTIRKLRGENNVKLQDLIRRTIVRKDIWEPDAGVSGRLVIGGEVVKDFMEGVIYLESTIGGGNGLGLELLKREMGAPGRTDKQIEEDLARHNYKTLRATYHKKIIEDWESLQLARLKVIDDGVVIIRYKERGVKWGNGKLLTIDQWDGLKTRVIRESLKSYLKKVYSFDEVVEEVEGRKILIPRGVFTPEVLKEEGLGTRARLIDNLLSYVITSSIMSFTEEEERQWTKEGKKIKYTMTRLMGVLVRVLELKCWVDTDRKGQTKVKYLIKLQRVGGIDGLIKEKNRRSSGRS